MRPEDRDRERYRIYRRRNGELELIATTSTSGGIGLALKTLHEEGEFGPPGDPWPVGVLDRPGDQQKGKWIINPFAKPLL